jgi:hypothetical protein
MSLQLNAVATTDCGTEGGSRSPPPPLEDWGTYSPVRAILPAGIGHSIASSEKAEVKSQA